MTIDELIARWQVRRFAWFCLYYRSKPERSLPPEIGDLSRREAESAGAWGSLAELDNVLNDCQDAGLLAPGWQAKPPIVDGYHGGIAEDKLRARLTSEDLSALGLS